jgi:hypothetical protein
MRKRQRKEVPQQERSEEVVKEAGALMKEASRCQVHPESPETWGTYEDLTFCMVCYYELAYLKGWITQHTWPRPPLPRWGIPPTHLHLSSNRHLRGAMRPKFSTDKIRIWAIMLKNFSISRPHGR